MDGRRSVSRKRLHEAVTAGNLDEVKRLLPTRRYIDVPNSSGYTALAEACSKGDVLVAHVLLEGGADVNRTFPNGKKPIRIACGLGSTPLVDLLLYHGATVNESYGGTWTPLLHACKEGYLAIVEALADHGADVNMRCDSGTPLHAAVSNGHVEVVKILLRHGACVDVLDNWGWTPLHVACSKGCLMALKDLIDHGASVNAEVKFVKGRRPLHLAAHSGHADVADILLQRGASIDETDSNGQSALHIAVENESNAKSACRVSCNEVFELLLSRGALFDVRDIRGETPLRAACWDRNIPVVRALLKLGVKPIKVVVEMSASSCKDYRSTVILSKLDAKTLALVLDFSPSIGFCTEEHTVEKMWKWPLPCSVIPQICLFSTMICIHCADDLVPIYQSHFIKAYAARIFSPDFAGASARFVKAWKTMLEQPFLADCQREVEIMKILAIPGTEATYHDVIHQNRSRKWNFTALQKFSSDDCVSRFPIYGDMVYGRFLALQKFFLVDICRDFFYLTDPQLPPEITCKILNYLPNVDLLNVAVLRNKHLDRQYD